jgi:hypothetical protein
MKSLYKLQSSVAHEVHSRERIDATNLKTTKEAKEVLETVLTELRLEKEKEKKRVERLEQRIEELFQAIPDNTLTGKINTEEKIKNITQTMEEYKQEIIELVGKITPKKPPKVRSEREEQSIEQTTHIALEVKEMT